MTIWGFDAQFVIGTAYAGIGAAIGWAWRQEAKVQKLEGELSNLKEDQIALKAAHAASSATMIQQSNTLAAIQASLESLTDMVRHMRGQLDKMLDSRNR